MCSVLRTHPLPVHGKTDFWSVISSEALARGYTSYRKSRMIAAIALRLAIASAV